MAEKTVHIVRKSDPTSALCGEIVENILNITRNEVGVWYCCDCEDAYEAVLAS